MFSPFWLLKNQKNNNFEKVSTGTPRTIIPACQKVLILRDIKTQISPNYKVQFFHQCLSGQLPTWGVPFKIKILIWFSFRPNPGRLKMIIIANNNYKNRFSNTYLKLPDWIFESSIQSTALDLWGRFNRKNKRRSSAATNSPDCSSGTAQKIKRWIEK